MNELDKLDKNIRYSFFDEKYGYVYKILIEVDEEYLENNGMKYNILPGMEVSVEIETD